MRKDGAIIGTTPIHYLIDTEEQTIVLFSHMPPLMPPNGFCVQFKGEFYRAFLPLQIITYINSTLLI